jgi:hypothetical protein
MAGKLTLYAEATFDLDAARLLAEAIVAAPDDVEIEVDFSRVEEFHDSSVAILSRALARATRRALLRGLTQHQARLFRYLGVSAGDAQAAGP